MIPPKDIFPVPGDTSLKYGRQGTEKEKIQTNTVVQYYQSILSCFLYIRA